MRAPAWSRAFGLSCAVALTVCPPLAAQDRDPEVRGPFRTESGLVYEVARPSAATDPSTPAAASGPERTPVVLIHGSNLDRRMWPRLWASLPRDRPVVRYDWRGHGESPVPTEPYSNVDDLLEVVEHAGLDRPVLVGVSAGAQIALDAALLHPDRFAGLVLAAPSIGGYVPDVPPEFMDDLRAAFATGELSRVSDVMLASDIMAVPDSAAGLVDTLVRDNEQLWRTDPSLQRTPARPALERLSELTLPVAVWVGENDVPAMRAQAEILDERAPGAELVVVPGGGHLLNLTSPAAFEARLRDFLARLDGTASDEDSEGRGPGNDGPEREGTPDGRDG